MNGPGPLSFWPKGEESGDGTRLTLGYEANVHGVTRAVARLAMAMGKRALAGDLRTLRELTR